MRHKQIGNRILSFYKKGQRVARALFSETRMLIVQKNCLTFAVAYSEPREVAATKVELSKAHCLREIGGKAGLWTMTSNNFLFCQFCFG